MKKKYVIFTLIIFILLVTTFTYFSTLKQNNIYKEESIKPTKITKGISMNLEQTAGAGDYKTVTQSGWPTDGYQLNTELSRCENGSTLSWDDTKKVVIVSGNLSDKCYVYFDKVFTLASYVISQYTGTQGENGIYYHNSSLSNGAGDNSYRYAGANPNNYVCFGTSESSCQTDNLYRIIGVIDGKVKLIKYDYANSNLLGTDGNYADTKTPNASYYKGNLKSIDTYYWYYSTKGGGVIWSTSLLNTIHLNTNFINNIDKTWINKIATTTWKVEKSENVYTAKIIASVAYKNDYGQTEYNAKIGLIYISEYGFAADPSAWTSYLSNYNELAIKSTNWMYMGFSEWTISPSAEFSNNVFTIGEYGSVSYDYDVFDTSYYATRPTFFLNSSVTYVSGTETQSDPIIIN